ncbi:MAG TPA: S9 family peptidase, partial [Novosphingobium sp.]|nr:S9 family peptidase [Novosphingobium sp.]
MKRLIASVLLAALPLVAATAQVAPAPTAPATTPIPATDFARIPYVSRPELSPDGLYLGGLMGIEGRQVIAIVSLFDKAKPVVLALPEDNQAAWVRWVNNDHLIVGIRALMPV